MAISENISLSISDGGEVLTFKVGQERTIEVYNDSQTTPRLLINITEKEWEQLVKFIGQELIK